MPNDDGSFSARDLGQTICSLLGLRPGENVEIKRNVLDENRLMVIRHPGGEEPALT